MPSRHRDLQPIDHSSISAHLDFEPGAWKRGSALQKSGGVLVVEDAPIDPDEKWAFWADVQGSERNVYSVNISMRSTRRRLHVDGDCTCPVGHNCKHVVATLIEVGLASAEWPSSISAFHPEFAAEVAQHNSQQAPRFVNEHAKQGVGKTLSGYSNSAFDFRVKEIVEKVAQANKMLGASSQPPTARVTYHLLIDRGLGATKIVLAAAKTNIKKDGHDGATQIYMDAWPHIDQAKRLEHFTERDRAWARSFRRNKSAQFDPGVYLTTAGDRQDLLALISEGAAYLQSQLHRKVDTAHEPLRVAADPLDARLIWRFKDDAKQKLALALAPASSPNDDDDTTIDIIPFAQPLALDTQANVVAEVTGLPDFPALLDLLEMKPANLADWGLFLKQLEQAGIDVAKILPPLPQLPQSKRFRGSPLPTLTLKAAKPKREYGYGFAAETFKPFAYGEVSFCYQSPDGLASNTVKAHETKPLLRWSQDDQSFECARDADAEQAHLQTLVDLGLFGGAFGTQQEQFRLLPDSDMGQFAGQLPDTLPKQIFDGLILDWASFYFDQELRQTLTDKGWKVLVDESFPIPMRDLRRSHLSAGVLGRDGQPGWFDLDVTLGTDTDQLDLVAVLPVLIRQLDIGLFDPQTSTNDLLDALPEIVNLGEHAGLVAIDWQQHLDTLRPIMAWLAQSPQLGQAAMAASADFGMSRPELAALAAQFEPQVDCPLSLPDSAKRIEQLLSPSAKTPPLPPSIQADLRDYQRTGVDWMQRLYSAGFGGILADDMGLGKTLQTICFLAGLCQSGTQRPALIVAPKSVVPNWMAEFSKFAPSLKVAVHQGADRDTTPEALAKRTHGAVALITSYPLLTRDAELLGSMAFSSLILDEAQAVKNPTAKVTKAAQAMQYEQCFALSGTPVQNNLAELWSLVNLTNPGLLRDLKGFNSTFRTPIERRGDGTRQSFLNAKLKPFLLRRDKGAIADELPDKVVSDVLIEMGDGQKAVYEAIRALANDAVRQAIAERGLERSRIQILDALLRLRQVCCDPDLLRGADKVPDALLNKAQSAKLARLLELLDEMIAAKRRVLVFSQFTSMLDRIEVQLDTKGWRYLRLDGQTENRGELVKSFQDRNGPPIFLISLKAGGVGLNLTAADTVIHFDPWWNPAIEDQATDRAHRMGQDKTVFVYRLLAEGSVEQVINQMQSQKRELADALFDGGNDEPLSLSQADIDTLFSPI